MPGDEPLRLGVTVLRADADDVELSRMIPSELLEAGGFPGAVRSMRGPEPVQRRPLRQPEGPQVHVPSGGDVAEHGVGHDGPGRRTRPRRSRRRGGWSMTAPAASRSKKEHEADRGTGPHPVTVPPVRHNWRAWPTYRSATRSSGPVSRSGTGRGGSSWNTAETSSGRRSPSVRPTSRRWAAALPVRRSSTRSSGGYRTASSRRGRPPPSRRRTR